MQAALASILALIQQVLPLVTQANATGTIATIIKVLTQWLPIVVSEIDTLYEPVKNIIAALHNSGQITQDQKDALSQLDAKMDAAFEAAAVGLDPDAANG